MVGVDSRWSMVGGQEIRDRQWRLSRHQPRLLQLRNDRVVAMEVERAGMLAAGPGHESIALGNRAAAVDQVQLERDAANAGAVGAGRDVALDAADTVAGVEARIVELQRHA